MSSPSPNVSEPLGIFGGTFDPIHYGHLRLAEEARELLGLGRVLWIPDGQPTHRGAPGAAASCRLAMVRQAIAGNPGFLLDAGEAPGQPSYTVPTLERLRGTHGGEQSLVLLVGADAFAGLPTWRRWREIFDLAHVGVAHRPGFPVLEDNLPGELADEFRRRRSEPAVLRQQAAGRIATFAMTQLAISATQIRRLLINGHSPRYLLPDAVLDYIHSNHLYRNT